MVDFRPLLFINALALMLLVTAGFASVQRDAGHMAALADSAPEEPAAPPSNNAPETTVATASSDDAPTPPTDSAPVFANVQTTPQLESPQGKRESETLETEGAVAGASLNAIEASDTSPSNFKASPSEFKDSVNTSMAPAAGPKVVKSDDARVQVAMIEPQLQFETDAETAAEPEPAPEPTTAQLTLRSNVVGDSVRINGKSYGATRLDLELDPGAYEVVISKAGYKDWAETVRLKAGDDLTLRGKLEEYTRVAYQNGTWIGGVRTGDGTYSGADGLEYTGHFVDGQFDGKGTARYPDGSRYEGDWAKGERTGEGTFRAADGSSYTGQFDNDEFNGQGTLTRVNGDILTGQWSNGRLEGHGSLTTENGMLYVGGFKNGKFHGQGTLTYPDGRHYEGGFSNGEYHGEGSEIFADGKKYVGQYIEGEFHGNGTLMNPNGSSIQATFRYGEPYGQAKLTTPEGEVFNARTSEPGVCYRDKSYRATQCPPLEGW